MEDHYKKVEETCRVKPESPELVRWRVQSLWRLNYRVVTVHVFNPFVTVESVKAFLGKYVEAVRPMWRGGACFQAMPAEEGIILCTSSSWWACRKGPGRGCARKISGGGAFASCATGPRQDGEGVKGTAEKEEAAEALKRKAAPQAEASGEVQAAEMLSSLSDSLPSGQGECLVVSQGEVTSVTSGMEQWSYYSSAA
ncbi:hypothetical protein SKAU_G00387210 [Synaphobranchus kaupii]|uniref:Uncharacterized protein n=1 Tax=Synaphobranchus kaupii TaxID=118154 RepID=A0A9Q1EAV4_SYNKA|nr:hypothetical protein SKAU_G00387210 [Synaphobranchus kaupii]